MAKDIRLNLRSLRAWAKKKDPEATVGRSQEPGFCPIAWHLAETYKVQIPSVTQTQYYNGERYVPLDPFGRIVRFIQLLDTNHSRFHPVKAGEVLALIDRVEEEFNGRV